MMNTFDDYSVINFNAAANNMERNNEIECNGYDSCQALRLAYDNLKQRYNELYEKTYKIDARMTRSQISSPCSSPPDVTYDETDRTKNQPYEEKLAAYKQVVEKLEQQKNELQEQNGTLEDNIRNYVENNKELRNQIKELENNMRAQRKAKEKILEKERDNELTKHRVTSDHHESSVCIPELHRIASTLSRSEQEMKNLKECIQKQNQIIRMLLARYKTMNLNKNSLQSAIQYVNDINNSPDAVGDDVLSDENLFFQRNMPSSNVKKSIIKSNLNQSTLLRNLRKCDSNGHYLSSSDEESINLLPENYRLFDKDNVDSKFFDFTDSEPMTIISNKLVNLKFEDVSENIEEACHTSNEGQNQKYTSSDDENNSDTNSLHLDNLVINNRGSQQPIFGAPTAYQETSLDLSHIEESGIPDSGRVCPICSNVFPLDRPENFFYEHVTQCVHEKDDSFVNPKSCPMCKEIFDESISQEQFETHVNEHFEDGEDTMINRQFEMID